MNALKTGTMVCAIAYLFTVASQSAGAAEAQRSELETVMRAIEDIRSRLDERLATAPTPAATPKEQDVSRTEKDARDHADAAAASVEIEDLKAELARLQNRTELGRIAREDVEVISTYLSVGLLAFGAIMLGLEFGVLFRARRPWNELDFKIIVTTLVVLMGVFLVVAGFSQEQITPVIGLLGAIVGYVLGRESFGSVPRAAVAQPEAKDSAVG